MYSGKVVNINDIRTGKSHLHEEAVTGTEQKILHPFFMGPIDLRWIAHAAKLPGKSLHLALAAAHESRLTRSSTVKLTPRVAKKLEIEPAAKLRALRHLLKAGLFHLEQRKRGKSVVVRLVGHKPEGTRW